MRQVRCKKLSQFTIQIPNTCQFERFKPAVVRGVKMPALLAGVDEPVVERGDSGKKHKGSVVAVAARKRNGRIERRIILHSSPLHPKVVI